MQNSRLISFGTVGSLPLAKNALHSTTSIICMFVMGNVHTVMLYMLLMRRDYSNLHIYSTTALCEMSSIVCKVMNDINTVV